MLIVQKSEFLCELRGFADYQPVSTITGQPNSLLPVFAPALHAEALSLLEAGKITAAAHLTRIHCCRAKAGWLEARYGVTKKPKAWHRNWSNALDY